MKNIFRLLLFSTLLLFGCKKEEDEPRRWVTTYTNVTLGDQHNNLAGHFFQPSTGGSIKVENTVGIEKTLAMMFFTESGGAHQFLTFPANGEEASTFGTKDMIVFTRNPGGVNFWPTSDLVSGMVYKPASATKDMFDELAQSADWKKFDTFFKDKNNGKENLEFKLTWSLSPKAGDVLLVQYQGYVRAILCVRNIIPSSASGGSIRFDAIVEGREIWENNENAKHLQPVMEP